MNTCIVVHAEDGGYEKCICGSFCLHDNKMMLLYHLKSKACGARGIYKM